MATLPRVNLLPPEIEEARKFRQIQICLGAAVVAAVGIVGLLFVSANHSVDAAQASLDSTNQTTTQLNAENAKYADVTAIYARAAAAQSMLTQAMGDEVRYSQLLNDLSLSVPANVWVSALTLNTAPVSGAAAPGLGSNVATIGNLTVSGIAFQHDDVASWLDSLAVQKTYTNPYFSSSNESKIGSKGVVNFSSTAGLTDMALSHRYDKAGN
jgi:Tfp pilus assembly protein PilN